MFEFNFSASSPFPLYLSFPLASFSSQISYAYLHLISHLNFLLSTSSFSLFSFFLKNSPPLSSFSFSFSLSLLISSKFLFLTPFVNLLSLSNFLTSIIFGSSLSPLLHPFLSPSNLHFFLSPLLSLSLAQISLLFFSLFHQKNLSKYFSVFLSPSLISPQNFSLLVLSSPSFAPMLSLL